MAHSVLGSSRTRTIPWRLLANVAVVLSVSCRPSGSFVRSSVAHDRNPNASAEDLSQTARSIEALGVSLLKTVDTRDRPHTITSPFGLAVVLSMVGAGARGNTAKDVENVLGGLPLQDERHHRAFNRWLQELSSAENASKGSDGSRVDLRAAQQILDANRTTLRAPVLGRAESALRYGGGAR